ncbi:MAG: PKD domain-containing protein [Candidatus Gracilibacteria bacterium]|nr:PKD domain-containing protein [Candidatus Gracilibacteria bacterium]
MKKNFKYLFFIFLCLFYFVSFGALEKAEDVFIDITSSYKYLPELQSLYDKGIILPDENNKFNPSKLLTRDEFVGTVMEVSCKKCIKPNTALEYILKYTGKEIFYDLKETNKYFFCIAEAKDTNVVKGYLPGYVCSDGTTNANDIPFCSNNNITLEEALAVLLRNSSIFTIEDNNKIISDINSGIITTDLSNDVKPKSLDGNVYTFYGYFKKALELSYSEYDIYGNQKKYPLVIVDSNGNLNPKKYISKEEFLKMSYIITKINSCGVNNNSNESLIAGKIEIYDKDCKNGDTNCSISDLKNIDGIYDYNADVKTDCSKGILDYTWLFYNKSTGENFEKKGKYVDNYKFSSYGNWQIRLISRDNCGKQVDIYNEINYLNQNLIIPDNSSSTNNLGVSIKANPIMGSGPLKVDFESIVKGCDNCKFSWNFGDGTSSNNQNATNTFTKEGIYNVNLTITDKNGNTATTKMVINVNNGVQKSSLAGNMKIYDKSCKNGDTNCNISDLNSSDGTYDYNVNIKTSGVSGTLTHTWTFYNKTTGKSYTKTGEYVDNYKFDDYGDRQIKLVSTDDNGNKVETYSEINYLNPSLATAGKNNLGVSIKADPIIGDGPLKVDFESIVKGCDNCKFSWNFGDGNISNFKNPLNVFIYPGVYNVNLTVTNSDGSKSSATVVIKVTQGVQKSSLAGKIEIYDETCKKGDTNCNISNLNNSGGVYDYSANVKTSGISGTLTHTWTFYNKTTGKSYTKTGEYIDNYKFDDYGDRQIKLVSTDDNGNKVEVYNEINYLNPSLTTTGKNNLGVSIKADPIIGDGPLKVDFESIVKGCDNCKFNWDFGDGTNSIDQNPINIFKKSGVYSVNLKITDKNGNTATASVIIVVNNTGNLLDTDGDGIYDVNDKCIIIKGPESNLGCPILEQECDSTNILGNNSCNPGYFCNKSGYCEVNNLPDSLVSSCIYPSNGSSIFGNMLCNTCPCDYNVGFLSSLRKCDIVIPAITSLNKKEIYGKGNFYQIPY